MIKIFFEKNVIFWAVFFFMSVSVLLYITNDRRADDEELTQEELLPLPVSSQSTAPIPSVPDNGVRVLEKNSLQTTVIYKDGSFHPHEITVKNETSCYIAIENKSGDQVIPRLGPYDPKKETGFPYPAIAPGSTGMIDPRYGMGAQFSFYDKNNPNADFIVHIDPTCF